MLGAGTSLGGHQIIGVADVVEVGTFDPDGFLFGVYPFVDEYRGRAADLVGRGVVFANPDGAVPVILGRICRTLVVDDVAFPIGVEKERGVDAAHFANAYRVCR